MHFRGIKMVPESFKTEGVVEATSRMIAEQYIQAFSVLEKEVVPPRVERAGHRESRTQRWRCLSLAPTTAAEGLSSGSGAGRTRRSDAHASSFGSPPTSAMIDRSSLPPLC